jgi:predicted phage-related endonuclease
VRAAGVRWRRGAVPVRVLQGAAGGGMNAPAKILSDGDDTFRASHVGASEVAALFDASPFLTHFELWHRKQGNIATPDFMADGAANNERIEAGIRLEPTIIEWACDRWHYQRRETPKNLSNGNGLGGHPDQLVTCPERGPGLLEVKTADWLVAKKWGDEPPLHYLLQTQAYIGLAGCQWGDVVVLVGGNQLQRFQYDFRPAIFAEIEARVTAFWQSVRANDPPKPDFARDGATLTEILGEPTEEVIDLRRDNEADHLACDFLAAKAEIRAAEQRAEEAKNALLLKIGNAGVALLPAHRLTANQTKGSSGTLITAEHVGTTIGARKGYRRFDLKETN